MLLTNVVNIKWSGSNRKHFEGKGYVFTNYKDEFPVDVNDLTNSNKSRVDVNCDYCGDYYQTSWNKYKLRVIDGEIKKSCCKKCIGQKFKESFQLKYGVSNPSEIKEVVEKRKIVFMEKFGFDNPSKSPLIKSKKEATLLKNYGVKNPMDDLILREKSKIKKTNNGISCSYAQKYLNQILKGELNYNVSNIFIDIAFVDEKIYIEYDGSGHDLQVKYNQISKEDFDYKELQRYNFLKNLGWKMIRIVSNEKLPRFSEKIIQLFNLGKILLLENNWVVFDINNHCIISKTLNASYDYGHIIKITKDHLKPL
jgi:very-short-patch-repair endonuclease